MKRKYKIWITVVLAVITIVGLFGKLVIYPAYEDFITRPSGNYLSYAQYAIKQHFPTSVDSVKLLRVDRVIAASFFTVELTREDIEQAGEVPSEFDFTIEKSPNGKPTEITIYTGLRSESRDFLYLEKVSDDLWYGGHMFTPNEKTFWRRFEENRRYLSE